MNALIQSDQKINILKFDFQAQFQMCLEWNDPEQWEALAMLYYQRGFIFNAVHCFDLADAARTSKAGEA